MRETGNIYLIGFMGVGKTTVSKKMREQIKWEEVDTDRFIVSEKGMEISEIFEKFGERYFRDLETNILKKLAKEGGKIISCGGGVILKEENRKIMKESGTVVLLTACADTIYEHVKDGTDRPLLNGNMNPAYIEKLMEERKPYYDLAKDVEITTDGKTPLEIAQEMIEILGIKAKELE
ncbi:MAG: shikimate kinase [Lachnospiraceae bacterium]|nr:shikimate kinase [Lachnospiraceae bacterium]